MRRALLAALAIATALATTAAQAAEAAPVPDTDDVLAGRCEGCLVIAVDVGAEAVEATYTLGADFATAGDLRYALGVDLAGGALSASELAELIVVVDGVEERIAPAARDRINAACTGESPDPDACNAARDAAPPAFRGAGRLVVQYRSRETDSWPGEHRMWSREVETPDSGLVFALHIRADRDLAIDGDLEAVGPRHWRHRDLGRGYVAVSTAPDWAALIGAYRSLQQQRIADAAAAGALAAIPAAAADASRRRPCNSTGPGSAATCAGNRTWPRAARRRRRSPKRSRAAGATAPT